MSDSKQMVVFFKTKDQKTDDPYELFGEFDAMIDALFYVNDAPLYEENGDEVVAKEVNSEYEKEQLIQEYLQEPIHQ